MSADEETKRAIEAVFRIEYAKLVAGLTRLVRDIEFAEEIAQDALVAALEHWPSEGIPDKPGAWLMTTAKRRGLDLLKSRRRAEKKREGLTREILAQEDLVAHDLESALDENVGDDLLRLMLVSCHPVLPTEGRVALTLRLIGGLTTTEIARAFLVAEPTIAQRIVRAKRTLAEKKVPFEVPRGQELTERLGSVLEVIYLVFNEGYSATAGEDWMRPELCADALRVGRILAELVPEEPEVHGLVALMEIQASRTRARTDERGEPILLMNQSRAKWDRILIGRGLKAIDRAAALNVEPGPYLLQASIAACHARALTPDETDWVRIATLYAALMDVAPSPVVELNRAVAVGFAYGPEAALSIVDELAREPSLKDYHLLYSVRADLLAKVGRTAEARADLERAVMGTTNARERALLEKRAAELA